MKGEDSSKLKNSKDIVTKSTLKYALGLPPCGLAYTRQECVAIVHRLGHHNLETSIQFLVPHATTILCILQVLVASPGVHIFTLSSDWTNAFFGALPQVWIDNCKHCKCSGSADFPTLSHDSCMSLHLTFTQRTPVPGACKALKESQHAPQMLTTKQWSHVQSGCVKETSLHGQVRDN